jgi:hypothetical protein
MRKDYTSLASWVAIPVLFVVVAHRTRGELQNAPSRRGN